MNRYFMIFALFLFACATKPPADSPASTAHSASAPKSSVEAKQVAAEESAAFVTEITFKKLSDELSATAKKNLSQMLHDARKARAIDEIKTIAWADSEYPSSRQKELSAEEQNLAEKRNRAIDNFLRAQGAPQKITAYNMTARPRAFEDWLNTQMRKLKNH